MYIVCMALCNNTYCGAIVLSFDDKTSARFYFVLQISRSFSYRSLQTWLRSHIGQNPFGVSGCISQGRRLSWPLAGKVLLFYVLLLLTNNFVSRRR
jgi:hypothetical protein